MASTMFGGDGSVLFWSGWRRVTGFTIVYHGLAVLTFDRTDPMRGTWSFTHSCGLDSRFMTVATLCRVSRGM